MKIIIIFLILIFINNSYTKSIKKNDILYGFKLIDKQFIKEVNSECFYFEHLKSGAKLVKISNSDRNKTFCISFKTAPESDSGTPHIMEHCVLNGSQKFPVKNPFDILIKGSLYTFLNAFTGNDFTSFPIASMNEKDYFNLMNVYLDAVFFPLIYKEPKIFQQEGWHYELLDINSQLKYNGVVYNEMKGAYSNPERLIEYYLYKLLFPDNEYKYSSGGYPDEIPNLTYNEFTNYHSRYYNPANCLITLYGDADLEKELSFIDKEYLSKINKKKIQEIFKFQKPFKNKKEENFYYPYPENSNTNNQTFIIYGLVAGNTTNRLETLGLRIISEALFNIESAPIRLELQKESIGLDLECYLDELKQNVLVIIVKNANLDDKYKFFNILTNNLNKIVKEKLDKKTIEGILNRIEFSLREENDPQKGLTYSMRMLRGWMFSNDPFSTLKYEDTLSNLKIAIKTNFLENLIEKYILNNNHAALITLSPQIGLDISNQNKILTKLSNFKNKLNSNEIISLISNSIELIIFKTNEDSPENLKTIPVLNITDINPEPEWYNYKIYNLSNIPLFYYNDNFNNIVYLKILIDLNYIPKELIPYARLFTEIPGKQNTKNYSFEELEKELMIYTGGCNSYLTYYLENQNDKNFNPKILFEIKFINDRIDKALILFNEIINNTDFNNESRIKDIITKHFSEIQNSIKNDGFRTALIRFNSYITGYGYFNELTGGYEYYQFLKNLYENFENNKIQIINNLIKIKNYLINNNNLNIILFCDENNFNLITNKLTFFITNFENKEINKNNWEFELKKRNEAFATTHQVQYVIKGGNIKIKNYEWNGKFRVLEKIISSDYLQNTIRKLGGAYGGFAIINPYGNIIFSSFRDPQLLSTISNFNNIPEYIKNFNPDQTEMIRYIIGTIAKLDRPLTPENKGLTALRYYLEKINIDYLRNERKNILNTSIEDINNFHKILENILNDDIICVYGNEIIINKNKNLFFNIIKLD